MIVHIGSDHRGFSLKEHLKTFLAAEGHSVTDLGAATYDKSDDYPDIAAAVAREIGQHPDERRGIIACGSGTGVDIVANKFDGVRSVLGFSAEQVRATRQEDDVNVLTLAADFVTAEQAEELARVFLATPFERNDRHERRLKEIQDIERSDV